MSDILRFINERKQEFLAEAEKAHKRLNVLHLEMVYSTLQMNYPIGMQLLKEFIDKLEREIDE